MTTTWKAGEKVRHAGRPEWGAGLVMSAEGVLVEGKRCQRLSVRFERGGLKTLSTAFADLRAADGAWTRGAPEPAATETGTSMDPFAAGAQNKNEMLEILASVPEAATDPFATPRKRLAASLDLYRFNGRGGSLLDWATMQTGLKDPLSVFSRHELEQQFARFQANLEAHLRKLWREMRRGDPGALAEVASSAPDAARPMVNRLNADR